MHERNSDIIINWGEPDRAPHKHGTSVRNNLYGGTYVISRPAVYGQCFVNYEYAT